LYFANLHVNRGPAGEKNRFHMDDDGDLREQVLHIEAHIEELADVIESCRKIILISKAAIAAGGTLILAIITGAVGFDPTVMIGAIAAVIGGTVVFGSWPC
jgi:L-serine deaminase